MCSIIGKYFRPLCVTITLEGNIRPFAVVRKDIDVHERERLSNFK
jgi:hypothetical protein